ncbi:hypothetical protein [Embleya sp. NPDC020886]|uniref:hypothetical protein n=1 Tax=Embleya sp. NPDC020886 TaxID=3363980 RepID=UPI0037B27771
MNADETGLRVEEILAGLDERDDPAVRAVTEDLVRALMDFYGAGLTRLAALLRAAGAAGRTVLADELVTGLLVLHDLHPDDVDTRIARGLTAVADHPAEVLGFDATSGTLRLRVAAESSGCGCGSTAGTAREAIEAALACHAPEVAALDLEHVPAAPPEPALLQIGSRPAGVTR